LPNGADRIVKAQRGPRADVAAAGLALNAQARSRGLDLR
jgi:hypothetical protein